MKDSKEVLIKINNYIDKIIDYTKNSDLETFSSNDQTVYACAFALCQISELANKLREEDRQKYVKIPWADIRAIRNRIVHNYENVNLEILWRVAKIELPILKNEIKVILSGK